MKCVNIMTATNKALKEKFKCLKLLYLITFVTAIAHAETDHPKLIKQYIGGRPPFLQTYQKKIVRNVLDSSIDKFGDYHLGYIEVEVSSERIRDIIAKGESASIDIGTSRVVENKYKTRTEHLFYPLFDGVMGLRKLIVRKADNEKFSNIPSIEEFLTYTAAQGSGWYDVTIYQSAGVNVLKSNKFGSLFPMLQKNRFDYLPLSIIEAYDALAEKKEYANDLTIVDNTYIYYPMRSYICVTKQYTKLVERIKYGMKKSVETGSLQEIFDQQLGKHLINIKPKKSIVFVLNNPGLSAKENKETTDKLLDRYFPETKNIFHLKGNNNARY